MGPARGLGIAAALVAIGLTGVLAQPQPDATQQSARAVTEASQAAQAAERRAAELDRAAAGERDSESRARAEQAAAAQRIKAAEAEQAAAEARVALLDRLLARQRTAFAERQRPAIELVAALQAMARRPAVLALAQPGSAQDLVHVRATLASLLPAIEARSAGVRADLDRSRALRVAAGKAVAELQTRRAALESRRLAALQLESEHRLRAMSLGRDALVESDRALALGEKARDLAAEQDRSLSAAQIRSDLLVLSGPLPRPGTSADRASGPGPYRLPVSGQLVTGFGEISPAGVRARGPSFAVRPGSAVVAPAAGTIAYAAPFASYGQVVIVDHGKGWTSLISGISTLSVRPGAKVEQGATLGTAGPRITVELRRRGQPLDLTQLLD
ncbi:Septal ring factor EnvC, activator of murein hydrolases AmiA and AmiB [Sphingomonas sp. NFR04]|uniref:murein hydrolase activator EnvC family protein n=1 Tax=Sphingomonas sp. NFR04 TaxID=1566283 RepID=UPI0008E822C2|nr:peptidoglycan DD-metalloendopeptidase family protein [Sphingomonas sp. NFR04]SFJ82632.1 Septal ring factor EnvC, activator of murein hydrolases AmiA and AmiB [Sphingomonas sp. NFR04]